MSDPANKHEFSHVDEVLTILNEISIFAGLDKAQLVSLFQELEEVT